MKAIFGILTALLPSPALAIAQDTASQPAAPSAQEAASTEWWREAKFGMFIHWGLYAEPARDAWVAFAKAAGTKYFSQMDGVFSLALPKNAPDPLACVACLEWASGN